MIVTTYKCDQCGAESNNVTGWFIGVADHDSVTLFYDIGDPLDNHAHLCGIPCALRYIQGSIEKDRITWTSRS